MGAISKGLEIIWDEKQFLSPPPPSNLNYDWSLIFANIEGSLGLPLNTNKIFITHSKMVIHLTFNVSASVVARK